MRDQLSWGIIGTGAIAATFGRALARSHTGRLVAVASRAQATADAFAREFNADHAHGSYQAILDDPNVQAVYIATPHPLHAEWTIKTARAGKHVLCEKPLAINHADAKSIIDAARQNDVFFMEAFMYRCHPQTARLIELVRSKAIGDVRVIHATFSFQVGFDPESRLFKNSLAGGGILDVGCYTVSMSRLIAGIATGKDFADPIEIKGVAHLGQTGIDEWAVASLKFPGDILGQVATGVSLNQENVVRIYGSEGQITLPNPWTLNRYDAEQGRIIVQHKGEASPREMIVEAASTAFAYEADVVGNAVLAGKKQASSPAMTWDDSLENIRTLDRWRESIGLVYESEKARR